MFKSILLPLCLISATGLAVAADPLTEAMQKTYAPYRVALFKTNNNAQDDSRQAVLQAQQGWARVASEFGTNPPAPYAGDAEFAPQIAQGGVEDFHHVVPALWMAQVRRVGVREFVDEKNVGVSRFGRVEVEFVDFDASVDDL